MIDKEGLHSNLLKIVDFALFEDNWNGCWAEPFTKEVLLKMFKIVMQLKVQPEIFPLASGGIQFEYEHPNHDYLQFKVKENGEIYGYCTDENGNFSSNVFPEFEPKVINKFISEFDQYAFSRLSAHNFFEHNFDI